MQGSGTDRGKPAYHFLLLFPDLIHQQSLPEECLLLEAESLSAPLLLGSASLRWPLLPESESAPESECCTCGSTGSSAACKAAFLPLGWVKCKPAGATHTEKNNKKEKKKE